MQILGQVDPRLEEPCSGAKQAGYGVRVGGMPEGKLGWTWPSQDHVVAAIATSEISWRLNYHGDFGKLTVPLCLDAMRGRPDGWLIF